MSNIESKEKNLTEIWSKTFPKLATHRENFYLNFSGLLLGLVPFIFGEVSDFASFITDSASMLGQVYSGLLGFILAGYTIFASATNPRFLLAIWEYRSEENSNLPLLKVHALVFMRMFITLFLSLLLCLVLFLFAKLNSSIKPMILLHSSIFVFGQAVVLSLVGVTVSGTLTQLKILIFNIYDLVMTQAEFAKIDENKRKEKGCSGSEER